MSISWPRLLIRPGAPLLAALVAVAPAGAWAAGHPASRDAQVLLVDDATPPKAMPDGVQAELPTTTLVQHPTPECGADEDPVAPSGGAAAPNLGFFTLNVTKYSEWSNGKVVSTWSNSAETFLRCLNPPS